jgi:hypothetical protein
MTWNYPPRRATTRATPPQRCPARRSSFSRVSAGFLHCRIEPFFWDRVGDGVAPPPPTPPDMRARIRRFVKAVGLKRGLVAVRVFRPRWVPVGVGQGQAEDLGARDPPVSLATAAPLADVAFGDTCYLQIVPPGGGGLPFLPADLPQSAAQPPVHLAGVLQVSPRCPRTAQRPTIATGSKTPTLPTRITTKSKSLPTTPDH